MIVLGSGPDWVVCPKFAVMAGAKRVIAVDPVAHRLEKSQQLQSESKHSNWMIWLLVLMNCMS